jgi:hypothetical protein
MAALLYAEMCENDGLSPRPPLAMMGTGYKPIDEEKFLVWHEKFRKS